MTTEDAKTYLSKREIPRLFESLMTGLMFHRPTDHIQYLIDCLEKAKNNGQVTWNMFVEYKRSKTPLPPITPENGRRPSSRGRRSATPKEEPKPLEANRGAPLPPIGAVDTVDKTQEVKATDDKSIVEGIPDVPFVLVMGGPGSGKQTQIDKLLPHADGWVHISMGDLIRKEVTEKGTGEEKWKMIGDLMSRGDMASEEDACELFVSEIQKNKSAKGFIIEGYPRDMKQLEDFEKNVGRVDLVLLIDCEEKYLSTRLLKRGAINNRIDHNIQAVHKRILFFKDQTLPVIKYFDDQGKVKIFEGDQDEDALSQEMTAVFDNVIFGKEITTYTPGQPKVPTPPSEPKPDRQRSAKTKSPEPDTSEGKDLDIPDLPAIPDDMLPAEVKVKDMGRKSEMPECPIIFLAGGPGSGKGTQCKKIVERYPDVVHLSMGDILRTEISTKGTADKKWGMISTLLTKGDMAPEDVTIDLLITSIQKHPDARAFVIEGYPRDLRQVEEFNKNIGGVSFVILLDCEEYYLQERLINRGADSGRPDDNLAAIGKRIAFFKQHTLPILKHYDDEEKLVLIPGDRDDTEMAYDIAETLDFALFGRKPGDTEITEAVPPQTEESAVNEEDGQAPAAGQEESTEQGQQEGEGQQEDSKEVVEEEMVAATATVTGGDGGNKQYEAQLDAAGAAQEADEQAEKADVDEEKTDEQEANVQNDEGQAEAQKEDEEQADAQKADDDKTDEQQEDGQQEADAGQTAEDGDGQQNSEGQQQDNEGQQGQGDESQGQAEADGQKQEDGGQTAEADPEEKEDEQKGES